MTDHPCKGMTRSQIEAFEQIAVDAKPNCKWDTIDALVAAGVIARGPSEPRRDAMGVYTVPSFFVPPAVHAQWCAWCAEKGERAARRLEGSP